VCFVFPAVGLPPALLLSAVTVGFPSNLRVREFVHPDGLSMHRVGSVLCGLGVVSVVGLAVGAWASSWPLALPGLIVYFACWSPCNALFLAATGEALTAVASSSDYVNLDDDRAPASNVHGSTPLGPAFSINATLSLVVQTILQAVLFNGLNVAVGTSYQVLVVVAALAFVCLAVCIGCHHLYHVRAKPSTALSLQGV
jgi:hypothetical protein